MEVFHQFMALLRLINFHLIAALKKIFVNIIWTDHFQPKIDLEQIEKNLFLPSKKKDIPP